MKKITIDEFTRWPFAHNVRISPEGNYVVFQVATANRQKNCYETNLWAYHSVTGRVYPLTSSGKDGDFIFLSDHVLLFQSTRSNDNLVKKEGTTLWTIDLGGGEARFYAHVQLDVTGMRSLGKGRYLLSGTEILPKKKDWVDVDRLPFWLNGQDYTIGKQNGLYLFDAGIYKEHCEAESLKQEEKCGEKADEHGEEKSIKSQIELGILKPLTDKRESVGDWDLSPDGRHIIFAVIEQKPLMPIENQLYYFDLDSKIRKKLCPDSYMVHNISFSPDSDTAYIFAADGQNHGLNEDPQLFRYSLSEGSFNRVSGDDFDRSPGNSLGTDARYGAGQMVKCTERGLYFIETRETDAILSKFTHDGDLVELVRESGSIECFDFDNNTLYYIAMRDLELPELYICDGNNTVKITDFSKALQDLRLSPIESFSFSSNGREIDGFVIKPTDFEPGKKYPGLLSIHGGPKTVFGRILHHEMQLLAAHGFFVFYTNPHGSDGHGVDFSDIRGKYGTIDYEDLMNFTDIVLEAYPDIDPEALGVLGGSYGGFMTNWIIGHSNRFKAANAQRSISNWTSFYGVSDIGYYFAQDQTLTTPWDNLEEMWNRSPIKYARNVQTPTLFIHADKDYRCPLEQGVQMYTALRVNGVPTKLVIFKEENHDLSRTGRPESRIKRLREILEWFTDHLEVNHEGKDLS